MSAGPLHHTTQLDHTAPLLIIFLEQHGKDLIYKVFPKTVIWPELQNPSQFNGVGGVAKTAIVSLSLFDPRTRWGRYCFKARIQSLKYGFVVLLLCFISCFYVLFFSSMQSKQLTTGGKTSVSRDFFQTCLTSKILFNEQEITN